MSLNALLLYMTKLRETIKTCCPHCTTCDHVSHQFCYAATLRSLPRNTKWNVDKWNSRRERRRRRNVCSCDTHCTESIEIHHMQLHSSNTAMCPSVCCTRCAFIVQSVNSFSTNSFATQIVETRSQSPQTHFSLKQMQTTISFSFVIRKTPFSIPDATNIHTFGHMRRCIPFITVNAQCPCQDKIILHHHLLHRVHYTYVSSHLTWFDV